MARKPANSEAATREDAAHLARTLATNGFAFVDAHTIGMYSNAAIAACINDHLPNAYVDPKANRTTLRAALAAFAPIP